jgi:hypothetical protein
MPDYRIHETPKAPTGEPVGAFVKAEDTRFELVRG